MTVRASERSTTAARAGSGAPDAGQQEISFSRPRAATISHSSGPSQRAARPWHAGGAVRHHGKLDADDAGDGGQRRRRSDCRADRSGRERNLAEDDARLGGRLGRAGGEALMGQGAAPEMGSTIDALPFGIEEFGLRRLALMVRSTSGMKTVSPIRLRPFFTTAMAMERPTLGLK